MKKWNKWTHWKNEINEQFENKINGQFEKMKEMDEKWSKEKIWNKFDKICNL